MEISVSSEICLSLVSCFVSLHLKLYFPGSLVSPSCCSDPQFRFEGREDKLETCLAAHQVSSLSDRYCQRPGVCLWVCNNQDILLLCCVTRFCPDLQTDSLFCCLLCALFTFSNLTYTWSDIRHIYFYVTVT